MFIENEYLEAAAEQEYAQAREYDYFDTFFPEWETESIDPEQRNDVDAVSVADRDQWAVRYVHGAPRLIEPEEV